MKTIEELNEIREKTFKEISLRKDRNYTGKEKHVLVCGGTGCTSSHSKNIIEKFEELIKKEGLDNVRVIRTGCFGLCAKGPIIVVRPEDTFYAAAHVDDVEEIVEKHLKNGEIVERLLCKDIDGSMVKSLDELNFYKKQHRIVLKNCGLIDPENIDEYLAFDGYKALEKVLTSMSPDDVIKEVSDSGLRGRGGAGFPTGRKWQFAKNSTDEQKYVACNADEGDPGAFMDRSVLEGDPHAIIEAMAIAAYAIGANKGYVYVRAEYPIAVHRLQVAIDQARDYGLLGDNIMEKGFKFDLEIRLGAGAFVCGEETALMESVEGRRGEPRPRPPFPAVKGLFGKPTLLNNVETYANITQIILNGASWYASIGTEKSKGTKVFALGGNINNVGLVEVPMGITLREIVYDIGGGIPNGRKFKAAQTGGPSGGCIPEQYLEQIFSTLKKSKLVKSVRGAQGGYLLNEEPKNITVGDVLDVLEGPVALSQCIIDEGCCENSNDCSTKLVWEKLKKGIEDVLNSITLQDMIDDYNKKNKIKEFDITELMNNKK